MLKKEPVCYTPRMTEADVIAHWRKGARDSLLSARLLYEGGQYASVLFHCHLAVEKALKVVFMEEFKKEAPMTHDLPRIAAELGRTWTEEERKLFADLTGYAVAARYDDPAWAEHEATLEKAELWISRVDLLLSHLLQ